MDTVVPGEGVKPIIEGDVIRSDGTTVLGGDDKSGCAIVCEVLRVLRDDAIRTATSRSCSPSARRWGCSAPSTST